MTMLATTPFPVQLESSLRYHLDLDMPSFLSSQLPSHPSSTTLNLSMQVEDILIKIFRELDLDDLLAMKLVSRRLRTLVDSKVVWVDLLRRLRLPLPLGITPDILSGQDEEQLRKIAIRAVRLDKNWRSSNPTPISHHTIQLDSAVLAMTRCEGVLFTAHKDGHIRCWRGLDPLELSSSQIKLNGGESLKQFSSMKLKNMTRVSFLQVTQDVKKKFYIVVYAGDAAERKTLCGVYYVPTDPKFTSQECPEALQFEETKGIVSIAVSSSAVIVARAQGNISIMDLASGSLFVINPEPILGGNRAKILRVHALEGNRLLVLTSDTLAIYQVPTSQQPHVGFPTLTRSIPRSVGGWVQANTAYSSTSTLIISLLTSENEAVRLSLNTDSEHLIELVRESLPYSAGQIAVSDLQGGVRRSVWIHWRRGEDGWPVHVLGANHNEVDDDETGGALTASSMGLASLAAVSSDDNDHPEGQLSEVISKCTKSCAMPRINFDEGSGTMVVAGYCSSSLEILRWA